MAAGLFAFIIALLHLYSHRSGALIGIARRNGDLPGPRKVHLQPIPLLADWLCMRGVVLGVLFLSPVRRARKSKAF